MKFVFRHGNRGGRTVTSQFSERTAFVTGGASGIGRAVCTLLHERGANVFVTDIDDAAAAELVAQLGERAGHARLDVSSPDSWQSASGACIEQFGSIDVLVNNAGVAALSGQISVEDMTMEEWQGVNHINMDGVMLGCQLAIRHMKSTGGAIVNVASVGGLFASPLAVPYGAGKAAVIQLTKTVAFYCGKQGYDIRCNAVLPGPIETPMFRNFTEEQRKANTRAIPVGRFGRVEEIAAAIAFLASDDASYVTGVGLAVDGGLTAGNPMRAGD